MVAHYIDYHLFGGLYVFERMLYRIVPDPARGGEDQYRWPGTEYIEKGERRQERGDSRNQTATTDLDRGRETESLKGCLE